MAATRAPGVPRTYDAAEAALLALVDNTTVPPALHSRTPEIRIMGSTAFLYRDHDGVLLQINGPEPQLWTFESRLGSARGYPVVGRGRGHLVLHVAARATEPGRIVSPTTADDPLPVQVREALLCLAWDQHEYRLPAGVYRCAYAGEMSDPAATDALVLCCDDNGDRVKLAIEVHLAHGPVVDLPGLPNQHRHALAAVAAGRVRLIPDDPFGDAVELDGNRIGAGVVLRLLTLGLIRAFPDGATALTAEGDALLPVRPDTDQEW